MVTRAPLWLRPIHQWFFFWDRVISSIYRVLAVLSGAIITTVIASSVLSVAWFIVAPIALVSWIGLAILQEHDERVQLPVHPDFLSEMHRHVTPLLASRGFVDLQSSGPCRARASRQESFIYQSSDDPDTIYVYRDPIAMVLHVDGHLLPLTGDHATDAQAVAKALGG